MSFFLIVRRGPHGLRMKRARSADWGWTCDRPYWRRRSLWADSLRRRGSSPAKWSAVHSPGQGFLLRDVYVWWSLFQMFLGKHLVLYVCLSFRATAECEIGLSMGIDCYGSVMISSLRIILFPQYPTRYCMTYFVVNTEQNTNFQFASHYCGKHGLVSLLSEPRKPVIG